MKRTSVILIMLGIVTLAIGTLRDANFWMTANQRGDSLMRDRKFAEAAKTFGDPWRIGVAQYRNGDFEAAAKTFARVPGATGAFDQGNAWLMHGNYDAAIASYDRALGFRSNWREAVENKALAQARKAKMDGAGENRADEQTGEQSKPDDIAFDQKGGDKNGEPTELSGGEVSDEELRATWLRRVQTTPGDFLRAKFAYQAAHVGQMEAQDAKKGGVQ